MDSSRGQQERGGPIALLNIAAEFAASISTGRQTVPYRCHSSGEVVLIDQIRTGN